MKAIIKLDIPEYQIGQEVSIYFKDTMMIKGVVQKPKTDILNKIRAEIAGLTYYWCEVNPKTVIDDVLQIINKYKAESEDKE